MLFVCHGILRYGKIYEYSLFVCLFGKIYEYSLFVVCLFDSLFVCLFKVSSAMEFLDMEKFTSILCLF